MFFQEHFLYERLHYRGKIMYNKDDFVRLKEFVFEKFMNSFQKKINDEHLNKKLPLSILSQKKITFFISTIFIIAILIISLNYLFSTTSNIPLYKVIKGNFVVSITESGEIRAKNSTSIVTPHFQGNLKIIYMIPEGTYVRAGDTLVKFDPTQAYINLNNAKSKLKIVESDKSRLIVNQKSQIINLESSLKSAELSFQLSKLNLEQVKFEADIKQQQAKLEQEKNQLNLDKAKQDLESQKVLQRSELEKIDIQIMQAKADLKKAENDLDALTLTAPQNGLVVYETNWNTGRKVSVGDTPWPEMPLISLPDLSEMQSITFVNEVDVSMVRKGQKVEVKLDAFQDSTFNGVIMSVSSLARNKDRNSDIKVFEVDVDINSQSSILKPGMTTSNKIIIERTTNKIYVPQECVFEKDGKKIVYIKNGNGFNEKDVVTGEKNDNFIVITRGLETGESVALIDPSINLNEYKINYENNSTAIYPSIVK